MEKRHIQNIQAMIVHDAQAKFAPSSSSSSGAANGSGGENYSTKMYYVLCVVSSRNILQHRWYRQRQRLQHKAVHQIRSPDQIRSNKKKHWTMLRQQQQRNTIGIEAAMARSHLYLRLPGYVCLVCGSSSSCTIWMSKVRSDHPHPDHPDHHMPRTAAP